MTVLELTRSAIALTQTGLGIHQAITRAADAARAPKEVVTQAFELASLYDQLSRFRRAEAAERLTAQMLFNELQDTEDETDELRGFDELSVPNGVDHGAN